MRMPWGKHRGVLISDVPSSYLVFVVEDSNASPDLKNACRETLADRFGESRQEQRAPWAKASQCESQDGVSREQLKRWYRRASLIAHPDRGGSTAFMKLINELMEL